MTVADQAKLALPALVSIESLSFAAMGLLLATSSNSPLLRVSATRTIRLLFCAAAVVVAAAAAGAALTWFPLFTSTNWPSTLGLKVGAVSLLTAIVLQPLVAAGAVRLVFRRPRSG